jgi:Icc-related predicted phosphoesterase
MSNAIYIFHSPPSNMELDVTFTGLKVGSIAEYNFLKENQPLMSFHGHIHESPDVSGKWFSQVGQTICIQPGQSHQHENTLNYVLVDLENMNLERKVGKRED